MNDSAVAAIKYALEKCEDPFDSMWFLRLWNEGDFESIREEYEDVPDEVFIDADPLLKSPAHIEDGEEVEVVGYRHVALNVKSMSSVCHQDHPPVIPMVEWSAPEPLMTVAQHERMTAGISAERTMLLETFVALCDYLGIDPQQARKLPGKPSEVFIAAIEGRAALSAPPAAGVPEGVDPCPGCLPGGVCRTPTCGRLLERNQRKDGINISDAPSGFRRPATPPAAPPASEQQRAVGLDVIDELRIELLPEYEAGYTAVAYGDSDQPVARADGMTARVAIAELLRLNPHLAKGEGV